MRADQRHPPAKVASLPARLGERVFTALGLVAAAGALLSLLLVGLPVVQPEEFLSWWSTASLTLLPASLPLDRLLKPLFWRA